MGNHLMLFMHPDKDSFNGAILKTYGEELQRLGEQTNVRAISKLGLDTDLQKKEYEASMKANYPEAIQKEHEWIKWADVLTLIFPLWWGGFPASGKAYLDRVLSYKFAYEMEGEKPVPLIKNKKIAIIYTTGTPEEKFKRSGGKDRTESIWKEDIFTFCGFTCLPFLNIGNAVQAEGKERERMFERVRQYAQRTAKKEPGNPS